MLCYAGRCRYQCSVRMQMQTTELLESFLHIVRRRTVIPAPSYSPNKHATLKSILSRLSRLKFARLILSATMPVKELEVHFSEASGAPQGKTDFDRTNALSSNLKVFNEPFSIIHAPSYVNPTPFPLPPSISFTPVSFQTTTPPCADHLASCTYPN